MYIVEGVLATSFHFGERYRPLDMSTQNDIKEIDVIHRVYHM